MSTQTSTPSAGSRGIGDRYYPSYGNGGFDVATYDIHVSYDPESRELSGTTMITATTTHDLSEFSLDFALDTLEVYVDGRPAGFVKDGLKLVITPAQSLSAGAGFVATVRYAGVPENVELAGRNPWTTTPTGAVVIGMPEVSTTWFPSNDHPRNKAVYRIAITVPEGLAAISNGNLVAKTTIGDYTTWSWYEPHPMATYLTLIAIGRLQVDTGVTASGLPYVYAVAEGDDPEYALARKDIERTAEVVDWMAERFGPYPFDAIGAVVPDGDIVYAPEPQTRPVFGKLMWQTGESNILTVVHENAHQWFGNSVSLDQWRDIWLSESFARYAEWLWTEDHDGKTAQQIFGDLYAEHPGDDTWWTFLVGEPGAGRIFEDPLYGRGAMTLQALRNRVGETTFRRILQQWTSGRRFGNAAIEDFVAHASAVAGTDLGGFFDVWLFTASKPDATADNGFPAGQAPVR